ncbi:MAG: HAMP domain-containing protein [Spirulina sp. SIO3F2]|nr:HAMP domain-containing protein [Spirulina sp. SIO3F2]
MRIAKFFSVKFKLKSTLVLPFVLQLLAAVGLVGYLSFRNGQQAVNDLAFQLSDKVTEQIDQHIGNYLATPHLLQSVLASAFRNGNLDPNDFTALEKQFRSDIQVTDSVDYIYLGKENGDFIGVQRYLDGKLALKLRDQSTAPNRVVYHISVLGQRVQQLQVKPYDPRERPWYEATLAARQPTWSPIFTSANLGVLQISPTTPVYDPKGQLIGVLSTNLLLAQLNEFLNDLPISQSGEAFIIERSGELVASSTPEVPSVEVPGADDPERLLALDSQEAAIRTTVQQLQAQNFNLQQIEDTTAFRYRWHGQRYLVQVSPLRQIDQLDWLIFVVIPETDFMGQIHANTQNTLLLSFVALGLAIALGIRTAQWITKPLQNLSQGAKAIAEGNLAQQTEGSPIIEVDELSQSFNTMAQQLQDSFNALHQSEEALRLANEDLEQRVEQRTAELRHEKERSEQLLLNVLPSEIAERLKSSPQSLAEHFEEATILFADIVGFTSLAARLDPLQVVDGLNQIFSAFDELTEKYGLEKIKTIGDAYMVVGGLPTPRTDHAAAIANMALDMQAHMQTLESLGDQPLEIRIGINTGPVIAGVIGIKKFIYDLWGDAVNVASRMESQGKPSCIQVTEETYLHLKDQYLLEPRGTISVKGRGEMPTYWLVGRQTPIA